MGFDEPDKARQQKQRKRIGNRESTKKNKDKINLLKFHKNARDKTLRLFIHPAPHFTK